MRFNAGLFRTVQDFARYTVKNWFKSRPVETGGSSEIPCAETVLETFLYATRWEIWEREESMPVCQPRQEPSMHQLWERYTYQHYFGLDPEDERLILGMMKFNSQGELLVMPGGTPYLAAAYELEKLYESADAMTVSAAAYQEPGS